MTVSYSSAVASSHFFGVFWRLLFRWKGSVYKMIWPEMLLFTAFYVLVSVIYREALNENGIILFNHLATYCRAYLKGVPVTFVLGFYVNLVVTRWWGQYKSIPWPDTLAILVSNAIRGKDVRTRMMRRAIVRYANLAFTLTLRRMSVPLKKRFPDFESMVEEGLLLETEREQLEEADKETDGFAYWVPLVWSVSLVERARDEGYIRNDLSSQVVVEEINKFRGNCGGLLSYDKLSIPLVYTQVVTIAVYSFLVATIMGRQFLEDKDSLDVYFPFYTYLEVLFYLGWLKVAESLINPFGKDDEDFDVDGLVNRNRKISYLIADKMLDSHPELKCDRHWNEVFHKQELISTPNEKDREQRIHMTPRSVNVETSFGDDSKTYLFIDDDRA